MQQIQNLVLSSTLEQYHHTALEALRILQYENTTTHHFTSLLECFLASETLPSRVIYFYILEQLLLHNSDNVKRNKLSSLINLALSQSLDIDPSQPESLMEGLLLINIHLNNITKSNAWIPEVWRFMGKSLEILGRVEIKKYRQKEWGILLVLDKVQHKDLLYVFIKILSSLFSSKSFSILSDHHKELLNSLKSKTQQPLLAPIISNLSQAPSLHFSELDSSVPYMIKQYTPRILLTQRTEKQDLNLLKKKKNQLKKRVISDLRSRIFDRMQQKEIRDQAKMDRIKKRQKKELFIIEKQTAEAKKMNRMKKIAKGKGKGK